MATYTWTGSSGDGDFDNPANWTIGGVAATASPGSADDVVFTGRVTDTITSGTVNVNSITVEGGSSVTVSQSVSGLNTITVENGSSLQLTATSPALTIENITIDGGNGTTDDLLINQPLNVTGTVSLSDGGTATLNNGLTAGGLSVSGGATLNVNGTLVVGGTTIDANLDNLPAGSTSNGGTINYNPSAVPCFLAGTLIRTETGEVPIEDIQVGDIVLTRVDGQDVPRPVIWAGHRPVQVSSGLPDDEAGYPVRVLRNAIADGVPHRDLLVTSEHCVFLDGGLIPVRMLVNRRSIFYDYRRTGFDVFHIETDPHSLIIANGLVTESYLDTGNRGSFTQASRVVQLRAPVRSWEHDAAAPLTVRQESVEPLFRQIEARADAMGLHASTPGPKLIRDPDLRLVTADGRAHRPFGQDGGKAVFTLPGSTSAVRILSRAARPADTVGPFADDRRWLGVLVGAVSLQDAGRMHALDVHLTTPSLPGWYGLEPAPIRWTDGDAFLPIGSHDPDHVLVLEMQILAAGPYLAADAPAVLRQKAS